MRYLTDYLANPEYKKAYEEQLTPEERALFDRLDSMLMEKDMPLDRFILGMKKSAVSSQALLDARNNPKKAEPMPRGKADFAIGFVS